jgi:hypothetical protein
LVKFLWSWTNLWQCTQIIQTLIKLKPTAAKGYIKGIHHKHYESCNCIGSKSSIIGSYNF